MEVEVMEARLLRATELNGEMDDDDESGKINHSGQRHLNLNCIL